MILAAPVRAEIERRVFAMSGNLLQRVCQPGRDFRLAGNAARAHEFFVDDQAGRGEDRILHDLAVVGDFDKLCRQAQAGDGLSGQRLDLLAIRAAGTKI